MKIAFLFPGQGSVFPGMGRDLFTRWQACREIYEQASYVTGRDIAALSFNASRKRLIETANAHLVVFVHSLAVNAILQQHDITPDFLCGHSLGQFGAITAAEVLTMEEGLNLVKRRGTLLAANCNYRPGYMVAVRRCALNKIKAAIGTLGEDKLCIACFNGPDEIVVSGDRPTIRIAMRIFRQCGGSVSPLAVAGAFHSSVVKDAAVEFTQEIEALEFRDPSWPVVSTDSGVLLLSGKEIKRDLINHILQPIHWDRVLVTLLQQSVDRWIELGPGKVLTGLVLRQDRGAHCYPTNNSMALKRLVAEIGKNIRTK